MFEDSWFQKYKFCLFPLRTNISTNFSRLPDFYGDNIDVIGFGWKLRFMISRPHTAMVFTQFPACISFLT